MAISFRLQNNCWRLDRLTTISLFGRLSADAWYMRCQNAGFIGGGAHHPTQWNNHFRPILDLAGVKSWNTFVKGAVLVGIESERDVILLTPHRTLSPKVGFEPIQENALTLTVDSSTVELGIGLNEVVNCCVP